MTQQQTRSRSHPCWISSLSQTFTSGKAGHTVTGTGRKKVAKNTTRQINFKRGVERKYKNIYDRFIRDTCFRKTMLELGRTEEVNREMDKMANEDHTHHITAEEISVCRNNWWIRSNFVGSDTMPVRHRADFKEALSTLRRLKNQEDQAYHHQNWWQSSSSSWWSPDLAGIISISLAARSLRRGLEKIQTARGLVPSEMLLGALR